MKLHLKINSTDRVQSPEEKQSFKENMFSIKIWNLNSIKTAILNAQKADFDH